MKLMTLLRQAFFVSSILVSSILVTPSFADSLSTAADITAFSFPEGTGSISGTDISVTVPSTTIVTALTPTITVSAGASVLPASGVAQDFTSPVSYVVTAEDTVTTKSYTVTVRVLTVQEEALAAINAATTKADMTTALETYQATLGVNMTTGDYADMDVSRKPSVANYVIDSKPVGGFSNVAQVSESFNAGLAYEKAKWAFSTSVYTDMLTEADFTAIRLAYTNHASFRLSIGKADDTAPALLAIDIAKSNFETYKTAIEAQFNDNTAASGALTNAYRINDIFSFIRGFDKTAPVLSEITTVATPTGDRSPEYTFTSSEGGTISFVTTGEGSGHMCSSAVTLAASGTNVINFGDSLLDYGIYSNCGIRVTDLSGNVSETLPVSSFTVILEAPVADPKGGTYSSSQLVTLTSTLTRYEKGKSRSSIMYTLDGSTPSFRSEHGISYEDPIAIDGSNGVTVTLKAIVYDYYDEDGVIESDVMTENYTFNKVSFSSGGSYFMYPSIQSNTPAPVVVGQTPSAKPSGTVLGANISCKESGPYLTKYARIGYRNDVDTVKKLQEFLNKELGLTIPVTGFFGVRTEAALKVFQLLHKDTLLAPWNITEATGILYITTIAQINHLVCPDFLTTATTTKLIPFNENPESPEKI